MLPGPWGDGRNAPPSNEDIGRVAAGVLADPTPHIGKCYRPTGPELLAPRDIAEILTGVVSRTVKYQEVTLKMFLKAATAQGVSPFTAIPLAAGGSARRRGARDDGHHRYRSLECGRRRICGFGLDLA